MIFLVVGGIPNQQCTESVSLLALEIWKEMNARVFKDKAALVEVVVHIIKDETAIWVLAGARHLGNAMLLE